MTTAASWGLLESLGHRPIPADLPHSDRRFPDGSPYRVEIPSCEGPAVMEAVLDEAGARDVTVGRVSQGSGVMMLTDREIDRMVELGAAHDVEVCLFLGPRGAWGTGAQAKVSAAAAAAARGNAELVACVAEAVRAVDRGVRSLLVGDLGALSVLGELKKVGDLPADLALKTSVMMPLTNAPTGALYEQLGATSLNLSTDLDLATVAEVRRATTVSLDAYVEVPDDQGGSVRFYDVPDLVRVAAPLYVKLGVRNAPNIYPSGRHLEATAVALGRERVRRAELVLRLVREGGEA